MNTPPPSHSSTSVRCIPSEKDSKNQHQGRTWQPARSYRDPNKDARTLALNEGSTLVSYINDEHDAGFADKLVRIQLFHHQDNQNGVNVGEVKGKMKNRVDKLVEVISS